MECAANARGRHCQKVADRCEKFAFKQGRHNQSDSGGSE